MNIEEKIEIYETISKNIEKIASRRETSSVRLKGLQFGFKKVAFDTRNIDQETQINPRRGLQNFNRSEAFITQALSNKLKNLMALKDVLSELKDEYGNQREWQDSNARVLLSNLEIGLRTKIKNGGDGEFTDNQNGVGSFNYLEELLYTRYRLPLNELTSMAAKDLKTVLLSKDEELLKRDVVKGSDDVVFTKKDIGEMSYESLINTLFAGVKATQDNKRVKRKVTIEIEDSIEDE